MRMLTVKYGRSISMEQIMNEENEWDHVAEANMIEGPVERITHHEIVKAIGSMKTRKAPGPSEVNTKMVIASGETGIRVLKELSQRVLDGKGIPDEWKATLWYRFSREKVM